jgi:hypothetical protein
VTISFLVIISFFASAAHAAPEVVDSQKQANLILNNLLGINSDLYSTQLNSQDNTEKNGLSQSKIDYYLSSDNGSVRVSASFVNNNLNLLYLTDYSGLLKTSKSTSNTGKMATSFLENYRVYTGDSFYGTLAQTLNGITGETSVTKSVGNMTIKVQNAGQATVDYIWTFTDAKGINAQTKNVILSYYNGQFNCFLDNWNLYNIVGSPRISREQAIEIALASVKDYSYQVSDEKGASTVSVSGFHVAPESLEAATLSYVNCPDANLARDGNSYNLYPSWWIPIGFDKFYPGDVTGMAVTVWADSGKVGSTELMYADSSFANAALATTVQSTIPTEDKVQQSIIMLTPSIIVVAIVCVGVSLVTKAKLIWSSGTKKMLVLLFCSGIILSAMTTTVNANSVFPNSSARIYASLGGTPGYGPNNNYTGSPPQSSEEGNASLWVQSQLNSDFSVSGYTVYNNVGNLTTKQNILNNAQNDAANFDSCTVFQYGHEVNIGIGYVDNTGTDVYYTDINSSVTNNKYSFVLLWVCCQSQLPNRSVGISPICNAWMNNGITGSSQNRTDGYNYPDGSGQCFISFSGFSPWIGNDTRTFEQRWTYAMKYFIGYFYYIALVDGYSVRDSLNRASIAFFNTTYTSSLLYTGYDLWWPGSDNPVLMDPQYFDEGQIRALGLSGWYPREFYSSGSMGSTKNSMQVFGDGSKYLFQPKVTLAANYGSPTFSLDGTAHGTGDVNVWRKSYSVGVSVPSGYTFNRFEYNGSSYYSNPSNILFNYSGYLEAWFAPVTTRYLDVYSGVGGNTTPAAGSHPYNQGVPVSVTAYANSGYAFDYWIYDDVPFYEASNPVTITLNVDHSIQPVFYQLPPPPQPPTTPSVGGPSSGYVGQSRSFSASSTDPNGDTIRYIFSWGDGTSTTTGYYSSGSTAYASHTWSSAGQFSVGVTAEDSTGRFSSQSSPLSVNVLQYVPLTISSASGGTTNPSPGNYSYSYGQTQTVTANSSTGYRFDHWVLDDNQNAGSSDTITVTMNNAHTLQAVFSPLATYTLSVDAWCDEGFQLYPQIYVDGTPYYGTVSITVYAGYHTITVENPYYDCFYVSYFSDSLGNGVSRNILSNTYVTAYYYRAW